MYTTVWVNLKAFVLSGRSQTQEDLLSDFIYVKSTNQQNRSLVIDLRIAAASEKGHEGALLGDRNVLCLGTVLWVYPRVEL